MKRLNFLQILGFTFEIFSFVALVINLLTSGETGSRAPLYAVFLVGVVCVAIGNIIHRNKNQ
jgi:hypothetical protein